MAGWLAGYRLTRGPGQDWACGFVEREREEQALGQASGWMGGRVDGHVWCGGGNCSLPILGTEDIQEVSSSKAR